MPEVMRGFWDSPLPAIRSCGMHPRQLHARGVSLGG